MCPNKNEFIAGISDKPKLLASPVVMTIIFMFFKQSKHVFRFGQQHGLALPIISGWKRTIDDEAKTKSEEKKIEWPNKRNILRINNQKVVNMNWSDEFNLCLEQIYLWKQIETT